MNTLDRLKAARQRISDPKMFQRDLDGGPKGPNCGVGALMYSHECAADAAFGDVWHDMQDGYRALACQVAAVTGNSPKQFFVVEDYNDAHTHAEVLALFDRAIAVEQLKLDAQMAAVAEKKWATV